MELVKPVLLVPDCVVEDFVNAHHERVAMDRVDALYHENRPARTPALMSSSVHLSVLQNLHAFFSFLLIRI